VAGTQRDAPGPRSRVRRGALALAGLAISAVALIILFRSVDLAATGRALAAAAPGPLVLAIVALFVGLVLRIVRWTILLPPRPDGSRVGAGRVTPVLMIGYLGNAVLPARLGEVVRSYLISRREQIPFGGAFGSVVLERIVDTATLAVIAFLAAVGSGAASWIVQGTGIAATVGIVVVAMLATTGLAPIGNLIQWFERFKPLRQVASSVGARLREFIHWSGGAHRRRELLAALLLSLGAWLCDGAMFWLAGQAVGAALPPVGALLVMSITVLATAIPSAPAYVGTFELATVAVAGSLGVAASEALALAVIAHALALVPTAILGPIALVGTGGGLRRLSVAAVAERRAQEPGAS
jgi:uncharacterized protein (TIRG00374 family)